MQSAEHQRGRRGDPHLCLTSSSSFLLAANGVDEPVSMSLTSAREFLAWSEAPNLDAVYRGVTRRSSIGLCVRLDIRRPLPRLHTLAWAAGTRLTLPLLAELAEALHQVEAEPGNRLRIDHAAGAFAVRRGGRVASVSPPPPVVV